MVMLEDAKEENKIEVAHSMIADGVSTAQIKNTPASTEKIFSRSDNRNSDTANIETPRTASLFSYGIFRSHYCFRSSVS
jgi:hypothetical protein